MKKSTHIYISLLFLIILPWCSKKEAININIISEQSCITTWWIVVSWLSNGLSWDALAKALKSWTLEISSYAKCPQGTKKIGTVSNLDSDIFEEVCCK